MNLMLMLMLTASPLVWAESPCNSYRSCKMEAEKATERLKLFGISKSKSGHLFTLTTHLPEMGEAWRDEDGLIWGDIAMKDGKPLTLTHAEAEKYCAEKNASLPSVDEVVTLFTYLGCDPGGSRGCAPGFDSNKDYLPEILPHLDFPEIYQKWDGYATLQIKDGGMGYWAKEGSSYEGGLSRLYDTRVGWGRLFCELLRFALVRSLRNAVNGSFVFKIGVAYV